MKILNENPPNIEEIRETFDTRGFRVVYAYGDTIFNPDNIYISPFIEMHERTHCHQQQGDPESWWRTYIAEMDFRFKEELLAHQVEYIMLSGTGQTRQIRRRALHVTAERLASPIYGPMLSAKQARRVLKSTNRDDLDYILKVLSE